jgi:hypothetical protein
MGEALTVLCPKKYCRWLFDKIKFCHSYRSYRSYRFLDDRSLDRTKIRSGHSCLCHKSLVVRCSKTRKLWLRWVSGTGFSLSSCDHRVRCGAEAKIGRIATSANRTGKSACATERPRHWTHTGSVDGCVALAFAGTSFSLSSCDHRVRCRVRKPRSEGLRRSNSARRGQDTPLLFLGRWRWVLRWRSLILARRLTRSLTRCRSWRRDLTWHLRWRIRRCSRLLRRRRLLRLLEHGASCGDHVSGAALHGQR